LEAIASTTHIPRIVIKDVTQHKSVIVSQNQGYFNIVATNHLMHQKDWLQRFEPFQLLILIELSNNGTKLTIEKGEITSGLT
jgi:hypothetical protein